VGEHSPTFRRNRWCCCPMRDLPIDFSREVFSRRCEEQKGDGVPRAEIGEYDSDGVCSEV